MTNDIDLKVIPKKAMLNELSEQSVSKDPFEQFNAWYNEAVDSGIIYPNAMIISTVNKKNVPSLRTVLMKSFDKYGFTFFTNYGSNKAKDLLDNHNASLLFLWKEMERQVRITGTVSKLSHEQSEIYFHSRPIESQLGAWASKQSSIIPNREHLESEYQRYKQQYEGKIIPMPLYWGGYKVMPTEFEFWQGRDSRLHDRICYSRKGYGWHIFRLSP
jgi:pyridoxamine-phosphate oxidase